MQYIKVFLAAPLAYVDWVSALAEELVKTNASDTTVKAYVSSTFHSRKEMKSDDSSDGRAQSAVRNQIELMGADILISFGLPEDKGDTGFRASILGLGLGAGKPVVHYGHKVSVVDYNPNIETAATIPLMKDRSNPEDPVVFSAAVRDTLRELMKRNQQMQANNGGATQVPRR